MTTNKVLALVPQMRHEYGHHYTYHQQANRAAEALGWKYVVVSSKHTTAEHWPSHWQRRIEIPELPHLPRQVRRLCEKHLRRACLSNVLNDNVDSDEPLIIFVEDPQPGFFKCFLRSLWLLRHKNITLWIHWHMIPTSNNREHRRLWFRLWAMRWMMPRCHLKLTAMTEQLAKAWEQIVGRPISIIPYPMGYTETVPPFPRKDDKILCLFAGLPGVWKGGRHIQALLDSTHPLASQLQIVCSEEWPLTAGKGLPQLQRLPPKMDRTDYLRWLTTADIVLLPYEPSLGYDLQMSGVFLESLTAGSIPIVNEGTWMADELRKWSIDELIVDYSNEDLPAVIAAAKSNPTLSSRLKPMREHYKNYHCTQGYATAMSELFPVNGKG